ncbi:uncharacterized protein N7518_006812 [Penicillium psychrosexuale]|uniref:uncharacterized protein n=1 Tax=Penicillium psychrosexuale TaxID=1002107 RepID=UPI002544E3C3|nr:uncharacterized protein N7518_006812 [Penicillium psychrosexuale]KAJ5789801.1 hypothetical protein N7518_006812 [Penicillium psychrosexuale]
MNDLQHLLLLQNLDVGFVSHETEIVANRGTSLIRLSHGERAVPRMISPNHQPILDDAGRVMDKDFQK